MSCATHDKATSRYTLLVVYAARERPRPPTTSRKLLKFFTSPPVRIAETNFFVTREKKFRKNPWGGADAGTP
jgi:hypothetical protein